MSDSGPAPRCTECHFSATATILYRDPDADTHHCGFCRPDLKRLHQLEDDVLGDSHAARLLDEARMEGFDEQVKQEPEADAAREIDVDKGKRNR